MAKIEITLPRMGEGVIEATITKWMVNVGDHVEEDDTLVEVATDKVDSEIPAPESGIVNEILLKEGDIPKIGTPLLILETESEESQDNSQEVLDEVERITSDKKEPETVETAKDISHTKLDLESFSQSVSRTTSGKFLSPLVRKIAEEEAVSMEELDKIKGAGKDGRITKVDLLNFINKKGPAEITSVKDTDVSIKGPAVVDTPKVRPGVGDEIIEMDRMRKLIAEHMIHSKKTSPHVTSFIEADVTNLVLWRNKIKDDFLKKENQKITFTPLFIEATAKALRDFPMINVSVDGSRIIVKKNINIGMATALPSGNLIVPVIKNADEKNLVGLVKSVNDLANRARLSKLNPDEITGGTFTITNFGSFQNLTGTPIINQPEVAILGVGAIVKKPAIIETKMGDTIGIRHIMVLSLSYDHRVVDGALGGMFLKRVADYLEGFDVDLAF